MGLVLLLSIWILPYRDIAARASPPDRLHESGRQMVPYALATALTGYTLVSPALTFVCLTWLALISQCEVENEPPVRRRGFDPPATRSQSSRRVRPTSLN